MFYYEQVRVFSLATIASFEETRTSLIREKRESPQKRLNSGEITVNYTGGEVARVVRTVGELPHARLARSR